MLVVLAGCSEAGRLDAARPVLGDLVPTQLVVPTGDAIEVDTTSLVHVRALDPQRPLAMRPVPKPDRSRRFWKTVDGAALHAGVEVHTTAPGATISLRPQGDARAGIDPSGLVLVDPDGVAHAGTDAMLTTVAWDELRAGTSPFLPGTSAFRIDPELPAGTWTIESAAPMGDEALLLHVTEPSSALVLTATTDHTSYLAGGTVVVDVEARIDDARVEIASATARTRSPAGRTIDVELVADGRGRLRGTLHPDEREAVPGMPWLVEVEATIATGDGVAQRNARVAFGYGVAAAGFDGSIALDDSPRGGLIATLGMHVVAPGRYAVAATVWGEGPHGTGEPIGLVQSAAWLVPGDDAIELPLHDLLDGMGDHFELRDLQLVDQSRVALLHRQATGATLLR
jgi:hypothetical protein